MRRINDELVGLEALTLGRLLDGHSWSCSFTVRFAPDAGRGRPTASDAARGLRSPPAGAGLFGPPGYGGGLFGPMTRFSCHDTCVGLTPLFDGSSEIPRKNTLPTGSGWLAGFCSFLCTYSTFSAEIKALRRRKTVFQACPRVNFLTGG